MKKGYISFIEILLLASALLTGCSHSTQVTNNTTNSSGPWVVTGSDPMVPLTVIDSTGETLSAILDTSANSIIGCVYRDAQNDTAVIWIGDSALPSKAVIGNYEFLFANYTDSSVDIAITDTAGDIGIAQNMNIGAALQASSIHTNKLGIAFKKGGAIPLDLTETISKIFEVIYQDLAATLCAAAAMEAAKIVVDAIIGSALTPGGGILATPLALLLPAIAILGEGCEEAFKEAWPEIEKLIMQIGTSNPAASPSTPVMQPQKPWMNANSLDQYISNMGPYWQAAITGTDSVCQFSTFASGNNPDQYFAPNGGIQGFPFTDTLCQGVYGHFSVVGNANYSIVTTPYRKYVTFSTYDGEVISGGAGLMSCKAVGSFRQ